MSALVCCDRCGADRFLSNRGIDTRGLTSPQKHLLKELYVDEASHPFKTGRHWTVGECARFLDTSPQGAVKTAASLVRKGLLVRLPNRRTFYRLPTPRDAA